MQHRQLGGLGAFEDFASIEADSRDQPQVFNSVVKCEVVLVVCCGARSGVITFIKTTVSNIAGWLLTKPEQHGYGHTLGSTAHLVDSLSDFDRVGRGDRVINVTWFGISSALIGITRKLRLRVRSHNFVLGKAITREKYKELSQDISGFLLFARAVRHRRISNKNSQ